MFGRSFSPYRHPERSRGIFFAHRYNAICVTAWSGKPFAKGEKTTGAREKIRSCTSFLFTRAIKLFYIENGLHLWKILSIFLIYISNKKIREDLKGKMLVSLLLERTKRHQKTEKRIENKSMRENSHCQWKKMENSIVWFEKMDGWWRSMTDGIHSIPA